MRRDLGLAVPATPVTAGTTGRLLELTDPEAVTRAIAEFQALGREVFLQSFGLTGSRDYFAERQGMLIDSKPLLSVAYGYQYPEHGPLSVTQFSGGNSATVRVLRGLGSGPGAGPSCARRLLVRSTTPARTSATPTAATRPQRSRSSSATRRSTFSRTPPGPKPPVPPRRAGAALDVPQHVYHADRTGQRPPGERPNRAVLGPLSVPPGRSAVSPS